MVTLRDDVHKEGVVVRGVQCEGAGQAVVLSQVWEASLAIGLGSAIGRVRNKRQGVGGGEHDDGAALEEVRKVGDGVEEEGGALIGMAEQAAYGGV